MTSATTNVISMQAKRALHDPARIAPPVFTLAGAVEEMEVAFAVEDLPEPTSAEVKALSAPVAVAEGKPVAEVMVVGGLCPLSL